ncbi:MAG: hypothetical protein ACRCVN_06795 [Spirochaetia bacterium]
MEDVEINDEILAALFDQSRFSLDPENQLKWKKELGHWIGFFSMDDFNAPLSDCLRNPLVTKMREDSISAGLNSAQVRGIGPRLVDGFFALPKGTQKGDTGGN